MSLATTGFYIGQNAGSNGTYNLNGGQLNMGWEYVGYSGTGTVTQTGGTLTQNGSYFALGENAGGVGTYSLSGSGLVSVENIIIGAAWRGDVHAVRRHLQHHEYLHGLQARRQRNLQPRRFRCSLMQVIRNSSAT